MLELVKSSSLEADVYVLEYLLFLNDIPYVVFRRIYLFCLISGYTSVLFGLNVMMLDIINCYLC